MSTKPITVKSANSGAFGAESPDFIVAEAKDRETYIPPIEFATASNFVRFGSAKEYYEQSIKRIYEQYPYDGSQKEKTQFDLKKINSKVKIVSEFPLNEYFYKKKYLILK